MDLALIGRSALVLGASGGLGLASAESLADEGARVAIFARNAEKLETEAARIGGLAIPGDVRDAADIERAVRTTVDSFGGLDIVVANAGVGSYHAFGEEPLEHIEEMIDVNLKGTIYTIRAALPHLKNSAAADVITLASEAGRRGFPGEAVYCASKFGQVGLTRALDGELRPLGIRATNVCPGGVATDFALAEGYGRPEDALEGMMTGDDVAEVVLFVLTRPRGMRILETAFRPMKEASWG
jgi:meso-butanediol dehydrogenase/(S,S)-butanediol dehydrogenase/diacetyl reductase